MGGFFASNGQFVTDEELGAWEEIYARGEFPLGEHTVGDVIDGAPDSQGNQNQVTLRVQIPAAMEQAITQVAKRKNQTTGEYVQKVLLESLVET